MTREQKELLYEIASWRSKEFYNKMDDHWTTQNFQFGMECQQAMNKLEKEYMDKYGELPEWKYIDDVWDFMKATKEELEETK